MLAKNWSLVGIVLILFLLSACGPGSVTEIFDLTETPTNQPQPEFTPQEETTITPAGLPCSNSTLGVTLTMPNSSWNCETPNEQWLTLTSPLFDINISSLGRGPFCYPGMDGCESMAYLTTDIMVMQLYTIDGQPRELFGLAQLPNGDIGVWVSVKWQDMATHPLTGDEMSELIDLVSSLTLTTP